MKKAIIILFTLFIPMLLVSASFGAETPTSAAAPESLQRRTERERQFLYRAVEELNRSQEYVQSAMNGLEKRMDAVDILESSKREKDIGSFLEWYRSYAEWLGTNLADIEADLSESYSEAKGVIVRPERFSLLAEGYARLGRQLEEQVSHLDKLHDSTLQRITNLRLAVDYLTSVAFIEERSRDKKQPPQGDERRKNELYERYKDITDAEIAQMRRELKNLDELQKHFLVLLEMGRMELSWISRKTGDCDALGRLARVVGKDAPGPIEEASSRVIKLYDADIVYFKRKTDDVARARSRVVPSGSIRTMDRMEELTENYDQMRNRFERHIAWLGEQAGAYRADIIELRKDR